MVSLNHVSHRKCIGFVDVQVDFLLQNPHTVASSCEIPGIAQLWNFQQTDSKFETMWSEIVGLM